MARKFNKIQEKVEIQFKEARKIIQDFKDYIAILRKNKTERIELKKLTTGILKYSWMP